MKHKDNCKDGKHDWMFEPKRKIDDPVCFHCGIRYLDFIERTKHSKYE